MQKRLSVLALAAALTLAASAVSAEPPAVYAHVKLASAAGAPAKPLEIGGLVWTCAGDACSGATRGDPAGWSPMYFCKHVAAKLGPLAAWSFRQHEMSAGDLATCNTAAAGAAPTAAK
ncbi:CC_3452 family protein [Caulobacter sp. KR2-114]|uniref:CC_3452 family protein n=1 Tax=Caulobacter sp. KR2-114 TaxID=3400912 RepID=UPI003C0BDF78